MFGLSNGNSNVLHTDIDYAAYLAGSSLIVYERGVNRGTFGTLAIGDVVRVGVEGGVVKYYRNGSLLYTSTQPPTYPLLLDTAINSMLGRISNALICGANLGFPFGSAFYVDSAGGNDSNSGTSEASAWRTLGRANNAPLAPGERLLLKRGSVWTEALRLNRSGAAGNPITVGAYGAGALPIIRGVSSCVELTGSHLVLQEVQTDNCTWAGVEVSGNNNRVQNSLITNNVAGVHVRSGATNNSVLNNVLRDNNRMSVLTVFPTDDDSGAFGVLLHGDNTEVAFNTISGCDAFSYDYGRDGGAIEVYGGRNNTIHHNLAFDNDAFSELGNSRSADNTFAYNVVRSSLATSVFLVTRGATSGYGPVARTRLYNNSVYFTGATSQGFVCHGGCNSDVLIMRNNVIQAVWKVGYADAPFDEDYDLFFGGILQFTRGSHSLVANPAFVDAPNGNLRLQSSSPAIDRGTGVGLTQDFDGVAVPQDGDGNGSALPDMGAFEYRR
jgi:hypothetical protein